MLEDLFTGLPCVGLVGGLEEVETLVSGRLFSGLWSLLTVLLGCLEFNLDVAGVLPAVFIGFLANGEGFGVLAELGFSSSGLLLGVPTMGESLLALIDLLDGGGPPRPGEIGGLPLMTGGEMVKCCVLLLIFLLSCVPPPILIVSWILLVLFEMNLWLLLRLFSTGFREFDTSLNVTVRLGDTELCLLGILECWGSHCWTEAVTLILL